MTRGYLGWLVADDLMIRLPPAPPGADGSGAGDLLPMSPGSFAGDGPETWTPWAKTFGIRDVFWGF